MSDEILDLEEEETTSWIKQVESLSKDGKKVAIRELVEYRDSDNYKEVLTYCRSKVSELNSSIYEIAYSREKCEATSSILDSYV
jgi:23S rRNA C2498 (ribose-2'-O)-methylase RlmM